MMYQGGKTKLAGRIGQIIRERRAGRSIYVEPFVGSAAVMADVCGEFGKAVGCDLSADLIKMWQAATTGWVPPTELTQPEYEALRGAEPSALRAFAGFPCSFGGKWFGGYARDPNSPRNYAAAASRSIVERAASIQRARFGCMDYRDLGQLITGDMVIYCDPPYAETLQYRAAGSFDSSEFWSTMRAWSHTGALVLVSEYSAPVDWSEVWAVERHTSTALDNRGARAVDRLFVWSGSRP